MQTRRKPGPRPLIDERRYIAIAQRDPEAVAAWLLAVDGCTPRVADGIVTWLQRYAALPRSADHRSDMTRRDYRRILKAAAEMGEPGGGPANITQGRHAKGAYLSWYGRRPRSVVTTAWSAPTALSEVA